MKIAVTVQGTRIEASENAPSKACCPDCGGEVTLRHRRRMGGSVTYYWRHRSNRNRNCRARKGISTML